ncbi:Multidrug resistance-associated protein 1 [Folsomia candida]|uniref:Multidrug resistance-associated protein 1 n=1 Tax=Folsomia candida TaxID=158441 RepID=A0A226DBN4_FOLCA|nr:Multidrug resistance-associated protein 1 [Folsomia candida]
MSLSAFGFILLSTAAATYGNIWLSAWSKQATIDEQERNGIQNRDTTNKYLSGYGGLGGIQSVAILIGAASIAIATLNASERFHSNMLYKIIGAPMWFFDTTPLGRLMNKFTKDVDTADITLPQNIRSGLNIFLNTLSAIFNIAYSTPLFLIFIAPVTVFYLDFTLPLPIESHRCQLKRLESVSRSPIYSKFGEVITGSTTIRAFGLQDEFISESHQKINDNQKAYYPFISSSLWITTRLETIGSFIIFASAVFAVASNVDPAIAGLCISSALQITVLLNFLVRQASDLESNIVSVERMSEVNETPQEAAWQTTLRPTKEWPTQGRVEFVNYETRYREGLDLVLRGISCTFNPGEQIGIVGRTGAGKSSLTLALFRLIEPTSGKIIIDGQDITEIGLHDLRSKITIIPQDPVLFSGILRTNLDPFDAHTDQQIWDSLESAHLKSYVMSLPQGLQYEVAEEGQNFSVGQKQLICLARALLRKTKILVLDEATAAVDFIVETDDLIQKTIRQEFADSTVITIAHRLNTIMDSTRIVVLDKGQIVEFDSPENLMAHTTSMFYSMAKDAGLT